MKKIIAVNAGPRTGWNTGIREFTLSTLYGTIKMGKLVMNIQGSVKKGTKKQGEQIITNAAQCGQTLSD